MIFYYFTSPYLQLSNEDLFRKVEKKEEEALLNRLSKKSVEEEDISAMAF